MQIVSCDSRAPLYKTLEATLTITWLDDRANGPAVPMITYNDPTNPGKAVVTGIDSSMEYRSTNYPSNWMPVESNSMIFEIPSSSASYYLRYPATDTEIASKVTVFTILAMPSAPSITYDSTSEEFTGLTTDMEVKINDGTYVPVDNNWISGTAVVDLIDNLSSGSTTAASFHVPASATIPLSKEKVITLYSRLQTPTALKFNPVTFVLTGTSSSMQYRVKDAASWTSISLTSVNLSSLVNNVSETIIEARYKPTTTNSASHTVDITLPKLAPAPSSLSVDLANELITGCVTGKTYQYSTNGSSWTNVTAANGSFSITSLISTTAKTLYVREAATSTTPYTDSVQFSIPARPAAPSTSVGKMVYNDSLHPDKAVLTGLDSTMEYKLSSDSNWTAFDGVNPVFDIPTSRKTYYVRYKVTADVFPSNNTSVTLTIRSTAPSVSINTTTELLSGVATSGIKH